MVHFFNAYSVGSSCNYGPLSPVGITGIAAILKTVLVAKINPLLNPYTILGWRKFIIEAQEQTNTD